MMMSRLQKEIDLYAAHKQLLVDELRNTELSENEKTIKNNTIEFLNRKIWDFSCMIHRLDAVVDTFLERR